MILSFFYGGSSQLHTVHAESPVSDNFPPDAVDMQLTVIPGEEITGQLKATDLEEDKLFFAEGEGPQQGTVDINEDGWFTYTADEEASGTDSFTFTVTDKKADNPVVFSVNSEDDRTSIGTVTIIFEK